MNYTLWTDLRLAPRADPEHVIEDACLVEQAGRIVWMGPRHALPPQWQQAKHVHKLDNRWVTPGLIDCHTHLVYGGTRAQEFALRLAGASYEEIARQGGGIVSTVQATRCMSEEQLLAQSLRRLEALLDEGVTAIEIKSGYGLDLDSERKMLRVARRLGELRPVTVRTTFLGAHALPPEFAGQTDAYVDQVCSQMMPTLAQEGLIDAVDVFCERIAFDLRQSERVLKAAQALKLPVKMHAEQLSNLGGTAMATRYRALSTDHLEYLDEAGVIAMKEAGTVAVLLPGAYYFLRETQLPPIELLRKHGVPMALSTDSNPGTSPCTSLLLMLNMGSTLFRLTVPEALAAVTHHAAQALGAPDITGELSIGSRADFVAWDIESLSELVYWLGLPRCALVVYQGAISRDLRKESS